MLRERDEEDALDYDLFLRSEAVRIELVSPTPTDDLLS